MRIKLFNFKCHLFDLLAALLPSREVRKIIYQVAYSNKVKLSVSILANIVQSLMDAATIFFIYLAIEILGQINNDVIKLSVPSIIPIDAVSIAPNWNYLALSISIFGIFSAQVAAAIARYFQVINSELFAVSSKTEVLKKVHSKFLLSPYIESSELTAGNFYQITNESTDVVRQEIMAISMLIENIVNSFAYLFVLFAISPLLILVVAVAALASFLIQIRPSKSIKRAFEATTLCSTDINQSLADDYRSIKLIKSMNLEKPVSHSLQDYIYDFIYKSKIQAILSQRTESYNKIFGVLLVCIMLTFSALTLRSTSSVIPGLAAYIIALQKLNGNILNITRAFSTMNSSKGKLALLEKFLKSDSFDHILQNKKKPHSEQNNHPKIYEMPYSIDIINLSFQYPSTTTKTLIDITTSISSGQLVGVVGKSGGGKSTFIDIIISILKPDTGKVMINGYPVDFEDSNDLRNNIAVVSQEAFIKHESIAENVAFYSGPHDLDRVITSLTDVNLMKDIEKLPQGVDTIIGDGGIDLSGGQKQRLSLARALYRQPKLLILDEVTSSQDTFNEALINQLISKLRNKCTILVVSHRLNICTICDKVLVIDHGYLVADGQHDDLINTSGIYRQMWDTNR